MKKLLLYLFFLPFSISTLNAQIVIINEDFEDQNLTQNPEWTGDLNNFSFFDDNGNTLLRLNDTDGDRSQLITESSTVYGSWEFYIEVPATSSFNRVYIYLISDETELDIIGAGSPGSANGYAIHTGGGNFDLVKILNGSDNETLLSSDTEIEADTGYQVMVTRSDDGEWALYVSEGYGSAPTLDSEPVNDNTFTESNYFGILIRYSSGNRENFYFDDIIIENIEKLDAVSADVSGATTLDITFNYSIEESSLSTSGFQVDQNVGNPSSVSLQSDVVVRLQYDDLFVDGDYTITINDVETGFGEVIEPNTQLNFSVENPFRITGNETISNSKIDIFFTEEIDDSFTQPSNFEIEGEASPDQVTQSEAGTIRLEFNTPLASGEYILSVSDIQSVNGWSLIDDDTYELFIFDEFEEGDLAISEFFYRVPVDWRTNEFDRPRYIELYNQSGKFLNLREFTFNGEIISSENLPIPPNEYLAVTRGEPVFLERFGERNFFEAENFPSLNLTTEDQIVVRSANDITADSLLYRSSLWGGNGRSLERKSFSVSSVFSDNWADSEDALRGSPGLPNTISVPSDSPEVVAVSFPVPQELRVEFSRALSPESVLELNSFSLTNNAFFESTQYNIEDRKMLIFALEENLLDQVDYSFIYENVGDIFGNSISGSREFEFRFLNPFRVLSADVEENNTVFVQFTHPLNLSTVSVSNFQLDDGTAPTSIEFPNSENVRLEFSGEFEIGSYNLLINDIESIVGWTIEGDTGLNFFVFDEYELGDIVINEFMYNTPEGYSKYVELYNTSDKILNIRDWELRRAEGAANSGGVISSTSLAIEPNGFLIVAEDTSLMTNTFGAGEWFQMNNFPGITQTQSDKIRLIDNYGAVAESLRYERPEWGGTNVALERRSAEVSARFVENWGESPNELLGTPGFTNEVEQDINPPIWESLNTFGNEAFVLRFNERLDEETATQIDNYSVEPAMHISTINLDRNVVEIVIDSELQSDTEYEITINGIGDLFGNTIESETRSIEFLQFDEAEPRQIVINEILYRRLQAGSPEFVEIYNRSEQNADLSGWTLSNASGSTTLPDGTSIRGEGYLVFTDTETFAAESDKIIYLSGFKSLSNNGDAVTLKNSAETVIDSLFYLPSWGDNIAGVSLERRDPDAISIDRANWTPSSAEGGSTPAEENSSFERDMSSPEIIFANLSHPDSLEVRFSEFVDLNQGSNSKINSSAIQQSASIEKTGARFLVNDREAELLFYDPNHGNRIILDTEHVIPGEEITLIIENFGDFQGNITSGQERPVAQPVQKGDLVFNEIMYDPIRDNRENLTNQAEYIEIVNRRSYAISAEGLFLHDRPDNNNQITSIRPVNSTERWIPANGVLLFHAEDQTHNFTDSKTAIFFNLDTGFENKALRVDRSTLSLPLSGREVYLADSTRTIIDMIDYRPEWHNPNLIDTRGKSLERVSPGGDTNDPANWSSNAQPIGGTPATHNSIFQETPQPLAETGISLTPNPFSPDGDGFDDNLFINYKFEEPDYLMRIRIYDRYGRLVRTLVDAHQAGFEGAVIWDGLTDDRLTSRIGIYIIYIEAYNSSTGRNRNFRETAVLARQF